MLQKNEVKINLPPSDRVSITNVGGLCDGHQELSLAACGILSAGESDHPSIGHQPPLVETAVAAGLEGGGDPGGPHAVVSLHTFPLGAGFRLENSGVDGMEGGVVGTARFVLVAHFSLGNVSAS